MFPPVQAKVVGFSLASAVPASLHAASPPAELNPVVQQYCVGCHNDITLLGNLSLEAFDVAAAHERAETAEKMIVKLRAGMSGLVLLLSRRPKRL